MWAHIKEGICSTGVDSDLLLEAAPIAAEQP